MICKEAVICEGRGAFQFFDVHSVYDLIQRVSNRLLRAECMTSKDRTAVCAERISGSGGLPEGPYEWLCGMEAILVYGDEYCREVSEVYREGNVRRGAVDELEYSL